MAQKFAGAVSCCTGAMVSKASQKGSDHVFTGADRVYVPVNMPTAELEWIKNNSGTGKKD